MNIVCFAQSTIPWPMLVVYTGNTNGIPTMQWLMLGRSSVEEQFFLLSILDQKGMPLSYIARVFLRFPGQRLVVFRKKKRVSHKNA